MALTRPSFETGQLPDAARLRLPLGPVLILVRTPRCPGDQGFDLGDRPARTGHASIVSIRRPASPVLGSEAAAGDEVASIVTVIG